MSTFQRKTLLEAQLASPQGACAWFSQLAERLSAKEPQWKRRFSAEAWLENKGNTS